MVDKFRNLGYNISMSLYKALDLPFERRVEAVMTYLNERGSLHEIARSFGISYMTLWRWVKRYQEGGKAALQTKKPAYKKSWKRLSKNLEEKIMFLKEQNPSLSVSRARQLMTRTGIKISNKGIWNVWTRYGLSKRPIKDPLNPFGISAPESEDGIKRAKMFVHNGDLRAAAKILNNLPSIPKDPVIEKIPEKLLSLRRKLDRLYLEVQKIPYAQYLRKIRRVRRALERKGYIYSSVIANFLELMALDAMKRPQEQIKVLNLLGRKMRRVKDSSLLFLFYFQQASTFAYLLKLKKAMNIVPKCRRYVYRLSQPYYWGAFGSLLTAIGNYKEAFRYYKMAFEKEKDREHSEHLAICMALHGYSMAGEYSQGSRILDMVQVLKDRPMSGTTYSLARAYMSFGQGKLADASQFYLEALNKASRGELYNLLYATSVGLASVAMAVNKKQEAQIYLQKYLPLMKKQKLARDELVMKTMLTLVRNVPEEFTLEPPLHLLNLLLHARQTLKITDYRKVLDYAKRHKFLGLLHRWIVFFPEPVLYLLEKGKHTGLPRAILTLPIFDQKIPVYHIKFLGDLVVSKNQHYMRTKLTPKEKVFLIHLALKAHAPGKFIILHDLYQNFWPHSTDPLNLIAHLITKIKKKIQLPSHLLTISSRYGEPKLINNGIHITTDHGEFEVLLTQIKTLERANEWQFMLREYVRAVKLFRGAPFEKMYDGWSENMRRAILNQLELEAINLIKICSEYKNLNPPRFLATAKKVLKKVSKIIPHSEEIIHFLKNPH